MFRNGFSAGGKFLEGDSVSGFLQIDICSTCNRGFKGSLVICHNEELLGGGVIVDRGRYRLSLNAAPSGDSDHDIIC